MEIEFSSADLAFRDEVRAFLDENLTPELREAGRMQVSAFSEKAHNIPWQKILYAKGWAAPSWPVEYGGPGWNEVQRYIFATEHARAGAPSLSPMGLKMCAPMLMGHGTAEQKAYYLPRILRGDDYWCQGYSEPGSGSDLASLQLRAVSDGDDYVLSGSKTWTSHAHYANRMFLLARTSTEGRPQQGITFLLMDMDTPGLTIQPIITLAGDHEVNQVFFDDVRVPKANRVGEENKGWTVAKYLLEFERGGGNAAGCRVSLERIRANAGDLLSDPAFRRQLVEVEIQLQAQEITEHRVMAALSNGVSPGPLSSLLKLQGAQTTQRLDELALETATHYLAVEQKAAREPGANVPVIGPEQALTTMPRYLNNRVVSIFGGSNEIQRNIIAGQILGVR